MALERLAGPHLVIDYATGDPVEGITQFEVLWIDTVGFHFNGSFKRYFVQMDGMAFDFATDVNNRRCGLALLNSSAAAPFVGDPWYSMLEFNGGSTTPAVEWALDRITHVTGEVLTTTAPGDLTANYAHLHDRFIRTVSGSVQYTLNAADSWHTEATISGFSNGHFISWSRDRGRVWLGSTDGKIVLYDYVNLVAASPVYRIGVTSGVRGLFYSAKHDVFVSIHQVGSDPAETYVWARTPLPASISAPSASPAVAAGRASVLTVRVLGSNGEACPNEVVAWALTGEGALDLAVTATDEDGYATNRVVVPVDAAGPNVQIDVGVTVP